MTQSQEELVAALNEGAAGFGSDLADELALLPRIERRREWKNSQPALDEAIAQVATRMGLGPNEVAIARQKARDAFDARVRAITTTGGHA